MRTIRDLHFSLVNTPAPTVGQEVNVWHWRTHPNDQRDEAAPSGMTAADMDKGAQFGGTGRVTAVNWREGRSGDLYPRVDVELTIDPSQPAKPGPPKQFPHRLELRYSDVEHAALDTLTDGGEDASNLIRRLLREAAGK